MQVANRGGGSTHVQHCHSGAARRAEPGIHNRDISKSDDTCRVGFCADSGYGFRAPLRGPGMTVLSYKINRLRSVFLASISTSPRTYDASMVTVSPERSGA